MKQPPESSLLLLQAGIMRSKAIIVGIDDYQLRPLTSAVNDACSFHRRLVELGLVADRDVQLFTSPPVEKSRPAESKTILDALYDVYAAGSEIDRFFFYYAGHGLLAYTDAAHTVVHTALMPADVTDLKRDGRLLIDFTDLLDKMSIAGPQEQFYFLDACRDLPYEHHPNVGPLGWGGVDTASARAQAALYAVSPLGTALGNVNGLGVFTGYLLEAIDGRGVALEYDSASDNFVVTMQSLAAYTGDAVHELLKGEPGYKLKYQTPELAARGPACTPLRSFQHVEPRPLTIHIAPDAAAEVTKVLISAGRLPLTEFCFPPRANHDTVQLPPNRYLVTAESTHGAAQPDRAVVDIRKVSETTIRVGSVSTSERPTLPDAGPLPSLVSTRGMGQELFKSLPLDGEPSADGEPAPGRIRARADEPSVVVEIEQTGPPYRRWEGSLELDKAVPPGAYRVRFRLGSEVFSETEVVVEEGRVTEVHPSAAISPLLREALGVGDQLPETQWVSESIGPMQAGILETALVIVGIKPFDRAGEMFSRFAGLIPPRSPDQFDSQPLSVVVAVDGNGWPHPPLEVLRGIRCRIAGQLADLEHAESLSVEPLHGSQLRYVNAGTAEGTGFERVGTLLAKPPGGSFFVRIESPVIGEVELAAAALPNRATVLTILLRPDGSVKLSQNLLRLPGVQYPQELVPHHIGFGKVLRQLQIGQILFQGGELLSSNPSRQLADYNQEQQANFLNEMLYAKWTDPVLSCMAYYAWERAGEGGSASFTEVSRSMMEITARNLLRYFGGLADSRIVHARVHPNEEVHVMDELLRSGAVPILAASARLLGRYAEEHERDAPVAEFARRIPSTQIWSVSFRPPSPDRSPQ